MLSTEARRSAEWARFWLRDGVEHLHAHFVTHAFTPHSHEGYVIATFEAGAEAFRYRGAEHRAGPGFVALLNPGEVHTGQAAAEQGWVYRTLYPRAETVVRAAEQVFGAVRTPPYFPHVVVFDPQLAATVRRYHELSERGDAAREAAWLELTALLLTRHADRAAPLPTVKPAPRAVQRALAYLDAHLGASLGAPGGDAVTLAALGALTGLSPFALLRTFRRQMGMTPHDYVVFKRVARAKGLLLQGVPIAEVAFQVGFYDQSHLTRHFRRVTGVTPKVFVRGARSS